MKPEHNRLTDEYDGIICKQLETNIVEIAPEEVKGKEFYIPHKAVVREAAEATKTCIAYNASANATPESPSLNKCLYLVLAFCNRIWYVLVRQRAYPLAVTADIQKAFLQIRVREWEYGALRFHWKKSEHARIEILRFTRTLSGLAPSSF